MEIENLIYCRWIISLCRIYINFFESQFLFI